MGVINIEVVGSFGSHPKIQGTICKRASAMPKGHAAAVADAIRWLLEEVMPAAIELDHKLQAEGSLPSNRFGLPEQT